MSAAFRLQRRLSGDKAAAAHEGSGWLADEFGTPTAAKNLFLPRSQHNILPGEGVKKKSPVSYLALGPDSGQKKIGFSLRM
jgi:hypothetical protein